MLTRPGEPALSAIADEVIAGVDSRIRFLSGRRNPGTEAHALVSGVRRQTMAHELRQAHCGPRPERGYRGEPVLQDDGLQR